MAHAGPAAKLNRWEASMIKITTSHWDATLASALLELENNEKAKMKLLRQASQTTVQTKASCQLITKTVWGTRKRNYVRSVFFVWSALLFTTSTSSVEVGAVCRLLDHSISPQSTQHILEMVPILDVSDESRRQGTISEPGWPAVQYGEDNHKR